MTAGKWLKTACNLCYINCGIEVLVNDERLEKVRGDRSSPKSQGSTRRPGFHIMRWPMSRPGAQRARSSSRLQARTLCGVIEGAMTRNRNPPLRE